MFYVCGKELRYTETLSNRITAGLGRSLMFFGPADMTLHNRTSQGLWPGETYLADVPSIQLHIQSAMRVNPFVAQFVGTKNGRESGTSVNR